LTIITTYGSTAAFLSNQGSRLPTSSVTDFSLDFQDWTLRTDNVIEASTSSTTRRIRLTGREVCPQNDASVYIKLDPADGIDALAPLFWTQPSGTNVLLFQGRTGLPSSLWSATGVSVLYTQSIQFEEICFSVKAPEVVSAEGSFWRIPLVAGQQVFFATPYGITGTVRTLVGIGATGYSPFVDGVQPAAKDISDLLVSYTVTSGDAISVAPTSAATVLKAFAFDHEPSANEFVENEEDFLGRYELGICGSYVIEDDGTYNPQEWKQHPYDCTDQLNGNKCMFCKGRANDLVKSVCLERLGSECNAAFNTAARYSFCNLEFECPASQFSFSLVLVALAFCLASIF